MIQHHRPTSHQITPCLTARAPRILYPPSAASRYPSIAPRQPLKPLRIRPDEQPSANLLHRRFATLSKTCGPVGVSIRTLGYIPISHSAFINSGSAGRLIRRSPYTGSHSGATPACGESTNDTITTLRPRVIMQLSQERPDVRHPIHNVRTQNHIRRFHPRRLPLRVHARHIHALHLRHRRLKLFQHGRGGINPPSPPPPRLAASAIANRPAPPPTSRTLPPSGVQSPAARSAPRRPPRYGSARNIGARFRQKSPSLSDASITPSDCA